MSKNKKPVFDEFVETEEYKKMCQDDPLRGMAVRGCLSPQAQSDAY